MKKKSLLVLFVTLTSVKYAQTNILYLACKSMSQAQAWIYWFNKHYVLVTGYALMQNNTNPLNPTSRISYSVLYRKFTEKKHAAV